jgi:hypothetical protein
VSARSGLATPYLGPHRAAEGRHDVAEIDDLDEVLDGGPVFVDDRELVLMRGTESVVDRGVLAQHAWDRASVAEEAECVVLVEQVEDASLARFLGGEVEDVDEDVVLADGLGSATPLDELELGDLAIGLKVVIAAGVAGAE